MYFNFHFIMFFSKKACNREQSCSIEYIFYIDSNCTKICKFVKKTRTKTSIRYAKENDREKEREREKGRRRDKEREGEIRDREM